MQRFPRVAWMLVGLALLFVSLDAWSDSSDQAPASKSSIIQALEKSQPAAGTGGGGGGSTSRANLQKSFSHFTSPWFALGLFSGLALATACAAAIAWHPRRSVKADPVEDLEQRKTLILLGMVGAVVSELVRVDAAMALVIFGIGGLIRFRTVLENPKLTGKAILVVIIGLACGLGEYAMAVFVTIFAWVLVFWLDSSVGFRLKLRMTSSHDPKAVMLALIETLRRSKVRVAAAQIYEHKRQIVVLGRMPTNLDPIQFAPTLRQRLPRGDDIDLDLKMG